MNPSPIVKPCQEKVIRQDNVYYAFDENNLTDFDIDMFNVDYWQNKAAIVGTAQGRGTTYFLKYSEQQWVLKHYYRGGFIGKLIDDSYLFIGFRHTRAAKEFQLLKKLSELNLPSPRPISYRVKRSGILYQADILTARIENAQDLVALLTKEAISEPLWKKVGACIRAFHQHGIYHHDLNAHNILIDNDEKIWLIDFDQGEQRKPQSQWQQENLSRLLRSFNKEQTKLPHFHWHHNNWKLLLEGYNSAKAF